MLELVVEARMVTRVPMIRGVGVIAARETTERKKLKIRRSSRCQQLIRHTEARKLVGAAVHLMVMIAALLMTQMSKR